MNEKYLPIGTVVLLNNATKRVMITGFCAVPAEDQNKIYDYSGCLYPEGYIAADQIALFDHSQIKEVFHTGLQDDEERNFKIELNKIVAEKFSGVPAASVTPDVEPVAPVMPDFNITDDAPAVVGSPTATPTDEPNILNPEEVTEEDAISPPTYDELLALKLKERGIDMSLEEAKEKIAEFPPEDDDIDTNSMYDEILAMKLREKGMEMPVEEAKAKIAELPAELTAEPTDVPEIAPAADPFVMPTETVSGEFPNLTPETDPVETL